MRFAIFSSLFLINPQSYPAIHFAPLLFSGISASHPDIHFAPLHFSGISASLRSAFLNPFRFAICDLRFAIYDLRFFLLPSIKSEICILKSAILKPFRFAIYNLRFTIFDLRFFFAVSTLLIKIDINSLFSINKFSNSFFLLFKLDCFTIRKLI